MPPQIHLIRHAQGYHNLCVTNHSMPDPTLTPLGEQQCRDLSQSFPALSSIDLIVASPIKRTLYTALLTFRPLLEQHKNLKIIALPWLQEISDLPCDTGSPLAELQREFSDQPVDLSLVTPGWHEKTGIYAPTAENIMARARAARRFLLAREERSIAVVTHGGMLHYLTKDWSDHAKFTGKYRTEWGVPLEGTGWANCEFRSYAFDDSTPESIDNATLIETPESRQGRKGREIPLTEAEQTNLMEAAQRTWEEAGFLQREGGEEKLIGEVEKVEVQNDCPVKVAV